MGRVRGVRGAKIMCRDGLCDMRTIEKYSGRVWASGRSYEEAMCVVRY